MEFDILKNSYCCLWHCHSAIFKYFKHTQKIPPTLTTALQLKFCNWNCQRWYYCRSLDVSQPIDKSSRYFLSLPDQPNSWPSWQYWCPPAKGCNILYRCISTAKNVFKGSSHREPPNLQTTKSRHFQSQVLDTVGVSMASGPSCTRLTLQLSGGSSSKQSRDRHIYHTLTDTTHVHPMTRKRLESKKKQAQTVQASLRMSG